MKTLLRIKMLPIAAAIVVVCLMARSIEAQRCEPFDGQPTLCAQFFTASDQIYIGPGVPAATQSDLASIAQPQASLVGAVLAISPPCYTALSRFLCVSYFQKCSTVIVNGSPVVLPQSPCRSDCLNANSICGSIFQQFGQNQTDCFAVTQSTGLATFPDGAQIYAINGTSVNVTCNKAPTNTEAKCGGPLIAVRDPKTNSSSCALRCPSIPYTRHEWNVLGIVIQAIESKRKMKVRSEAIQVTGWAGLFAWAIVFIPFVSLKQRREAGSHLTTCILIGVAMMDIAYITRSFVGHGVICKNDHTFARQSRAVSSIATFLMLFGGISTTCWCAVLTLNAVLTLYIGPEKIRKWRLHIVYHAYCWCDPLILVIIGFAKNRAGGRPGIAFPVWVDNFLPAKSDDGKWWLFALLILPVTVNVVVSYVMIILIFVKFIQRLPRFSFSGLLHIMRSQVRMLSFVLTFCMVATSFVVMGFLIFTHIEQYTKDAIVLVSCWSSGGSGCREIPPKRLSFEFNVWTSFHLGASAIYGALLFGTIPEVLHWWKSLFLFITTREKIYCAGLYDRSTHSTIFSSSSYTSSPKISSTSASVNSASTAPTDEEM